MVTKDEVMQYIWKIETRSEINELWDMLRARDSQLKEQEVYTFNVGDEVEFAHKGRLIQGTITKLNKTSLSVKTDMGNWKVAPSLLKKVNK